MKVNNSDKIIEDSMLKLASAQYVKEEGIKLLQQAKELYEVGEDVDVVKFEKICAREVRKNKIKSINMKNIAIAAMFFVVICIGASFSTNLRSLFEAETFYEGDTNKAMKVDISPQYIPKGFTINKTIKTGSMCKVTYSNKMEEYITYTFLKNNKEINKEYNAETSYQEVNVNGEKSKLTIEDEEYTLIWHTDDYFFKITAQGISEEELIKIAESVEETE